MKKILFYLVFFSYAYSSFSMNEQPIHAYIVSSNIDEIIQKALKDLQVEYETYGDGIYWFQCTRAAFESIKSQEIEVYEDEGFRL